MEGPTPVSALIHAKKYAALWKRNL